ncbi:hypothetical protein [Mechercharimyces sp. CAU 1602]|uniref:hypothetical protein n=1 Tax=Mechercharimyces sp. CAU 1602 TaxID=2973933 RepID=UPI00216155D8|nr:hypothetical protein [Mechercharimyces sp. CAU 1602]MCS1351529.1 hypothetical protein [Mechercharimyces sp. CAU 1602]
MSTYFRLLGKHGFKIWASLFVGSIIGGIILAIFLLIGGLAFGAGAATTAVELGEAINTATSTGQNLDTLALTQSVSPGFITGLLVFILFAALGITIVSTFNSAGTIGMITEPVYTNQSRFGAYFSYGFRYFFKILFQNILISLPIFLFYIIVTLTWQGPTMLAILVTFIFTIVIFLYVLMIMHAPIIMMADRKGMWQSIVLSSRLFFNSFGQVFLSYLTMLAIALCAFIVSFLFELIATLLKDALAIVFLIAFTQLLVLLFFHVAAYMALIYRYRYKLSPIISGPTNGPNTSQVQVPLQTPSNPSTPSTPSTPSLQQREPVAPPVQGFIQDQEAAPSFSPHIRIQSADERSGSPSPQTPVPPAPAPQQQRKENHSEQAQGSSQPNIPTFQHFHYPDENEAHVKKEVEQAPVHPNKPVEKRESTSAETSFPTFSYDESAASKEENQND